MDACARASWGAGGKRRCVWVGGQEARALRGAVHGECPERTTLAHCSCWAATSAARISSWASSHSAGAFPSAKDFAAQTIAPAWASTYTTVGISLAAKGIRGDAVLGQRYRWRAAKTWKVKSHPGKKVKSHPGKPRNPISLFFSRSEGGGLRRLVVWLCSCLPTRMRPACPYPAWALGVAVAPLLPARRQGRALGLLRRPAARPNGAPDGRAACAAAAGRQGGALGDAAARAHRRVYPHRLLRLWRRTGGWGGGGVEGSRPGRQRPLLRRHHSVQATPRVPRALHEWKLGSKQV